MQNKLFVNVTLGASEDTAPEDIASEPIKLGEKEGVVGKTITDETTSDEATTPSEAIATRETNMLASLTALQRELFNKFQSEREELNSDILRRETEDVIMKRKTPNFFWEVFDFIEQSEYVERFNEAATKIGKIPTELKILSTPDCYDKEGNLLPDEELNKILSDYGFSDENAFGIRDREPTNETLFYALEAIKNRGGSQFPGVYYKTESDGRRDADVIHFDYYMDRQKTLHTFYHETCHVLQGKDKMLNNAPVFSIHSKTDKMGKESQANFYASMYIALQMLQHNRLTLDMVNSLLECSNCSPTGGYNDLRITHRYLMDMLSNSEKYLNNENLFLKGGQLNIKGIYDYTKKIIFEEQTKKYEEYFKSQPPKPKIDKDIILAVWFLVDCINGDDISILEPSELEQLQIFLVNNITEAQNKGIKLSPIPQDYHDIMPQLCKDILHSESDGKTSIISTDKFKEFINDKLGKTEMFKTYVSKHGDLAEKQSKYEKTVILDKNPQNPAIEDMEEGEKLKPKNLYFPIKQIQHYILGDSCGILLLKAKIVKAEEKEKQRLEQKLKFLENCLSTDKEILEKHLLLLEKEKKQRELEAKLKRDKEEKQEEKQEKPEKEQQQRQGEPNTTEMKKQVENLSKVIDTTKTMNSPTLGGSFDS